jgi:uncharacterized protein YyaL (SSP411 family)
MRLQDPHDELKNQNVLIAKKSMEEVAKEFGMDVDQLRHCLNRGLELLNAVRVLRPRPHLDDKMLAGWNGLMISGFARAAAATGIEEYLARAAKAVRFLQGNLIHGDGRLRRAAYNEKDEGKASGE